MKTEIIKITHKSAIAKAVSVLAAGGVVIYPTETSYGIGADATNDKAVKKVNALKKRTVAKHSTKHLLIAFCDLRMADKYMIITRNARVLAKKFMPGPLSLIVETKADGRKIGFRIPDQKKMLSIIRKFNRPITTTSANITEKGDNYKIKNVIRDFNAKVELILDGGDLPGSKPSTLYDVLEGKVLRDGPISEKEIRDVIES